MSIPPMQAETFRKHWFVDGVTSSLGYSVSLRRDCVEFTDSGGSFRIDAEWAPGRGTSVHVFPANIPDALGRTREEVFDRLERAFAAAGWRLRIHV